MLAPVRMSVAACAAAVVALAISASDLAQSDRLIERSFASAFGRHEPVGKGFASVEPARLDPSLLHLSRLPAMPSGPALGLGDRITLTARSGVAVAYEVIEVRPLPAAATADTGPHLFLVTAVNPGQTPAETIRFIVEAGGQPADSPSPSKPHAL